MRWCCLIVLALFVGMPLRIAAQPNGGQPTPADILAAAVLRDDDLPGFRQEAPVLPPFQETEPDVLAFGGDVGYLAIWRQPGGGATVYEDLSHFVSPAAAHRLFGFPLADYFYDAESQLEHLGG